MTFWQIIAACVGIFTFITSITFAVKWSHRIAALQRLIFYSHAIAGLMLVFYATTELVQDTGFDRTTYMQIADLTPETVLIRPGEDVTATYRLRKRPGCVGSVRTWADPVNGTTRIRLESIPAEWPAGLSTQAYTFPIPDTIAPGQYRLYFTVRTKCAAVEGWRATAPNTRLFYTSPPVTATVTP